MSNDHHTEALTLLSDLVAGDPANYPLWFIVCGGSALQAHGIIHRATKDVDIFAEKNPTTHELGAAYPLSAAVQEAIVKVASILKLPENWLNASSSFLQLPLTEYPAYFWDELKEEQYGSHIRISYLSLKGLITLKTLAAIERDAARDTEDLIALAPTEAEMQEALDWCVSQNIACSSPKITTLLNRLNHGNLTQRYQA